MIIDNNMFKYKRDVRINNVSNNNCDIKYERAVVTFIDILGFKKIVENSTYKEINEVYNIISNFQIQNTNVPESRVRFEDEMIDVCPKFSFFSDSAVRIVYLKGDVGTTNYSEFVKYTLNNELFLLSLIQNELMDNNIFIRGGLTIGDIYFDDINNILFGPALNRAYIIESEIAIYPRITIDPIIYNEIHNLLNEELEIEVNIDLDGMPWIDYFGAGNLKLINSFMKYGQVNYKYTVQMRDEYLETIDYRKSIIDKNLKDFVREKKVFSKYVWLAIQHNFAVRQYFSMLKKIKKYTRMLSTNEEKYYIKINNEIV